ncbi:MAG: Uma2 family endonuclease [Lyngbya sp. HA4199-MV5]|jgi:Uma2 family endonuclease|nr:Uma2 family endonuclease [Lyngbya sp. HA4199-MV5]
MATVVQAPAIAFEAFNQQPLDHIEWIDGTLIEKPEMTAKTGRIQARLARYWGNHKDATHQGGEVYTETHCRTVDRTRCPDVAYLPPDLVAQYGDFKVLPHSFPLVAEIISPTDIAEEVFTKACEYLESACQEVWLIFPDSRCILVMTPQQQKLYDISDTVSTQNVLMDFSIAVNELIA